MIAANETTRRLADLAAEQATARAQKAMRDREVSSAMQWYLVQCVGQSDGHVLNWLGKFNFETYYPMVREMRALPKNKMSHAQRSAVAAGGLAIMRPSVVPFFPRYVFVSFDMGKHGWRDIFEFAGVVGMHCEGDRPAPISNDLIAGIRAKEIDGAVPGKTPARLIFKVGEKVRITETAMATQEGVVEELPDVPIEELDPNDRIRIAVRLFGVQRSVDLAIHQIEKI